MSLAGASFGRARVGQIPGAIAKVLCNNESAEWFNQYNQPFYMKLKLLAVALLASAALIPNSEAGNRHGNGNVVAARSGAVRSGGGAPSFRSVPARSFSSNRIYSGQRFSSVGTRYPRVNSNFSGRQFTGGNIGTNRINQFGNNQRFTRSGRGFASNNAVIGNRTGGGQFRNGNRLAPNWRSHVFAQRSANWQRNWNRNSDHWWHGHRCHFFNGSWVIFDLGFSPWWWWDYPYYGYGYGYGYPYNYGYGYGYNDPGVYDSQPAYQNGYDDQSGYQNGYDDQSGYQNRSQNVYGAQSANSTVAAAQEKLVREGFYSAQIDGVLGPETRHALVRFQTQHGLRISGELTTETLDALGLRQYANYGSN